MLIAALLLCFIKATEFALDSQALFTSDSVSYIGNALRLMFVSFRSYVYGAMIRTFALPFHSLRAIVAMHMIMGGLTAWLLALALMRFFKVRPWIAILGALVFAIDPVQILHEHMVMTETASLMAGAALLVTALEYLRRPALHWLIVVSFLGILLVSLRTVYVPVVLLVAVFLPAAGYWPSFAGRTRLIALALAVSCGSTALCHFGYRHLTGWLGGREPAYHYWTGFFLLGAVSPLVLPEDSSDMRISAAVAIAIQSKSRYPGWRSIQLWFPGGMVARLRTVFDGDELKADQAAQRLARAAILRNPRGYIRLAISSYVSYWRGISNLPKLLEGEDGSKPAGQVTAQDSQMILPAFGADVSNQDKLQTLARRYHIAAADWYVFLLAAPLLTCLALALSPVNSKGIALLLVWECLLLIATCFAESATVYRYLHPFSFTGIASVAILGDKLASRRAGAVTP